MPEEPKIMVCAPATNPRQIAGTSYAFSCSRCSRRVQVAPSGQQFVRENARAVIVCMNCITARELTAAEVPSPPRLRRSPRRSPPPNPIHGGTAINMLPHTFAGLIVQHPYLVTIVSSALSFAAGGLAMLWLLTAVEADPNRYGELD